MRPTLSSLMYATFLAGGSALAAQGVLAPVGIILSEQSRTAFSIQGAGARAMGLGGAFIALADDATAVSFNPAGLAQMVKPEISLVGRGLNRRVAFQDVRTSAGSRVLLADDSLIANTRFDPLLLAGTLPLRVNGRTLAVQLSIQRLIPLGEGDARDLREHPVDGTAPSELHQSMSQDGQIDLYSFALAYELTQRLLVGGSLNYWRGAWDLASTSSKVAGGATTFADFSQSNHLEGTNWNVGLLWHYGAWSVGLTRRTAFHADYTYSASFTTSTGLVRTTSAPYTTGLHWPSTTGLGLGYRPAESWLVALDVVRTPWSETRYMSGREQLNGLNFFDMSKGNRTPDATRLHVGLEKLFLGAGGQVVPVRVGFSREPQPVTDRVTGEQRILQTLSLGTGLKRGRYTFDLAYRYGWDRRTASQFLDVDQILSNAHTSSVGKERLTEHRLDVSMNVQFERGPIQDFLHHLFVGD